MFPAKIKAHWGTHLFHLKVSPSVPLPPFLTPTHAHMLQTQFLSNSWHSTFLNAPSHFPLCPECPFTPSPAQEFLFTFQKYSSNRLPDAFPRVLVPSSGLLLHFLYAFMNRICQNSLEGGHTV